jgi:hypothetical protein
MVGIIRGKLRIFSREFPIKGVNSEFGLPLERRRSEAPASFDVIRALAIPNTPEARAGANV